MHAFNRCLTVVLVPLLAQCLTPAADRARRDESVGQAQTSRYELRVTDGLAVVRNASDERLVLWQSAPSFELELVLHTNDLLALTVHNAMPGATLLLLDGDATIEPRGATDSKDRRFDIAPGQPGSLSLALVPPNRESTPFRFALMSDVQEAIDDVADIYSVVNRVPRVEFLLGAGDLTQRGDRKELERFERELRGLKVPYYTTLGNHELGNEPSLFQEFYGRCSFSFVHRGARFTLIDSASATIDQRVRGWLTQWLELGARQFHTLAMHIPPIDPTGTRNGAFASRDEAVALFAQLQDFEVDLTVYGHIHSFYDFDNAGVPAVISGGGGAIPERFDNVSRHFVVFDVDPIKQTFTKELVRVD